MSTQLNSWNDGAAKSAIVDDWTGGHWSVPINATVAKLVKFGNQPINLKGGVRCWANAPSNGPVGGGPRIEVSFLFPNK